MSICVLIADPDVSLVRSYREHLSRAGFEVATANNGLDCVRRLRDFTPDVLVLEVDMPWGGGVGVLDMMYNSRELSPVPAMVLTARRKFNVFEEQLLFESHCDYHVKPLAPELLAGVIRRLLDNPPALLAGLKSSRIDHRCRPAHRTAISTTDTAPVLYGPQHETSSPE